ncbi:WGR domain [Pseudocohnilembus persalinus]|uniref:NAD(+) ADP-ribosyltransferase n=1 Tax=Pseudocohnilembus persalinus TaxID=266149 RepID=A0A0V0R1M7_PSEPJ|nr:WGR domain [Pseudocohnilembus persalinus]|eukprot:KRX08418.1 WGR domain [Pseudocohnilembus persalinus]
MSQENMEKYAKVIKNDQEFNKYLRCKDEKKNQDKFYHIAVVQDKISNQYVLYIRFGKYGAKGQTNIQEFNQADWAIEEFNKILKDKMKAYKEEYNDDLQMFDNLKQNKMQEEEVQEGQGKSKKNNCNLVDPNVDNSELYKVHKANGLVYSSYLVEDTKFYKIQIIQSKKEPKNFYLISRYGKIGSNGKFTISKALKEQAAIEQYDQKYEQKVEMGNYQVEEDGNQDEDDDQQVEQSESEEEQKEQNKKSKILVKIADIFNIILIKLNIKSIERATVDESVPNSEEFIVYTSDGKIYSTYMVEDTKFYKIQVLQSKQKPKEFYFFSRYGKIDNIGKPSLSIQMTEQKAIQEFNSKYKQKVEKGNYQVEEEEEEDDDDDNDEDEEDSNDNSELQSDEEELREKEAYDSYIQRTQHYGDNANLPRFTPLKEQENGQKKFYDLIFFNINDKQKFAKLQLLHNKFDTSEEYYVHKRIGQQLSQETGELFCQPFKNLVQAKKYYEEQIQDLERKNYIQGKQVFPNSYDNLYKPIQKYKYLMLKKILQQQQLNKKIINNIYNNFLPKNFGFFIEVNGYLCKQVTEADKEEYLTVQELKFEVDYAVEFFKQAPKMLQKLPAPLITSLDVDFQIDEDGIDEERRHISKYIRNFPNLEHLKISYVEVGWTNEAAMRLLNSISLLTNLKSLNVCLFDVDKAHLIKFADRLKNLQHLQKFELHAGGMDEDIQIPYRQIKKKLKNLKQVKIFEGEDEELDSDYCEE